MDFVGRKVKKEFDGVGVCLGRVVGYDESSGKFRIIYEDGNFEELEFVEMVSCLDNDGGKIEVGEPVRMTPQLERRPNKKRRVEGNVEPGMSENELEGNRIVNFNVDLNVGAAESLRENELVSCSSDTNRCGFEVEETLKPKCDLVGVFRENGSAGGNVAVDVESIDEFDLNKGFNYKLNADLDSNLNHDELDSNLNHDELEGNSSAQKEESKPFDLDLNLDFCGEMEEDLEMAVETQKRGTGLDLNFGADLQMIDAVVSGPSNEVLEETHDLNLGFLGETHEENNMNSRNDFDGVQLNEEFVPQGNAVDDGTQGEMGSPFNQESARKRGRRRKVGENVDCSTGRALRRSARRGSLRNDVASSTASNAVNDSPVLGELMESFPDVSNVKRDDEKETVMPSKLQLPPSSRDLDLDGIPVINFFSVYSFLRSFSIVLFLSPFDLEDLIGTLKSEAPSTLIDSIHASILRMLRKHLEQLANEGCESASNCLRSLNWNLLDMITWPVFMVEYLLLHNFALPPGFELSQLKLLENGYYKQPASVKVELLRCLCDEMVEVEAIRTELNRRCSAADPETEFERIMNHGARKKKRVGSNMFGNSCWTDKLVDDANDWNSDDCCLCKMDGSLLCCDGCPAAYHSKCVGTVSELLPEGEWFCPECATLRRNLRKKFQKTIRGAEVLGNDPHGRTYFFCCSYLLVLDCSEAKSVEKYYNRDDVSAVIDVLKSSEASYGGIISKICEYWGIPLLPGVPSDLELLNRRSTSLASFESHAVLSLRETDIRKKPEENCGSSSLANGLVLVTPKELPNASSEGSGEMIQLSSATQNFKKQGPDYANDIASLFSNHSGMVGKRTTLQESSLTSIGSDVNQISQVMNSIRESQTEISYVNYYSFAPTAASVAEELMLKSSAGVNEDSVKPDEQIISAQMKVILKKLDKFNWPQIENRNLNLQKERCGWCFSCRTSSEGMDCLLNLYDNCVPESLKNDLVGLQAKRIRKGHLIDVICYILSVEDRLHGLLLGPWLNPQYSKHWRKSAVKATDIVSVKHLLLMLESNLHHRALSPEWSRHVDSLTKKGSAAHIVTASSRAKQGIGRKRAKHLDFDSKPSSNGLSGGLGICWWRGGNVSCQVFNWKVLPRSLVRKAARQGGGKMISGILYPESSDFAKRCRNVAWRAAVESSTSVEQLAVQVREFDMNIRWDDVENTRPMCVMDKESRKSSRLFKKAIVRRKSSKEGEGVKYLIDFGKRKHVPDVVSKHGSLVEDSSSERRKYWLSECYVPLHLLKGFEERKIARKSSSKSESGKFSEVFGVKKKSLGERGFSYLFAKAERSEYYQCGHCNKDVLIREAFCCQSCNGFFHKRHIRKSGGVVAANRTYTCYKCEDGRPAKSTIKPSKVDSRKGKTTKTGRARVESKETKTAITTRSTKSKKSKKPVGRRGRPPRSQKENKAPAVPLRRSTRKIKFVTIPEKKKGRKGKKGKKQKSKKKTTKRSKKVTSKKKRTPANYSYWLNGLRLSGKPDDERVTEFLRKRLFVSSEDLNPVLDQQPKCCLCSEAEPTSALNYISCEICGEWYHGEAYGLNVEKMSKLIGFRCHICLKRTPPICPLPMETDGSEY